MIKEFQGQYRFLSNFWICKVPYEGRIWRSVEHAYQASKCELESEKRAILDLVRPSDAKHWGRLVKVRSDWEEVKLSIMENLLRIKFQDPTLRQWLIDTGNQTIQEGNRWHDTFWGVDLQTSQGENHLGKILMRIRDDINGGSHVSKM